MKERETKILMTLLWSLVILLILYTFLRPSYGAELEMTRCNINKQSQPIQSSTGNIFILKDDKWQKQIK
jgi:SNF family Na+-dependent transporter